VSVGCVAIHVL